MPAGPGSRLRRGTLLMVPPPKRQRRAPAAQAAVTCRRCRLARGVCRHRGDAGHLPAAGAAAAAAAEAAPCSEPDEGLGRFVPACP